MNRHVKTVGGWDAEIVYTAKNGQYLVVHPGQGYLGWPTAVWHKATGAALCSFVMSSIDSRFDLILSEREPCNGNCACAGLS